MIRYVLQRLIFLVVTLLIVSFLAFALLSVWPIKVTDQLVESRLTPTQVQSIEAKYGLRQPFWVQYVKWLRSCAELQCGVYIWANAGVAEPVAKHLFGECLFGLLCYASSTLILLMTTFLLTWLLALPLGIYSATHQGLRRERAIAFLGYLWLGLPSFLLAIFASWFAYSKLNNITLAPGGQYDKFLHFVIVYALIIGMANVAVIMRHTRGSLLDILGSDYIQAARAKGLSGLAIGTPLGDILRHAPGPAPGAGNRLLGLPLVGVALLPTGDLRLLVCLQQTQQYYFSSRGPV